MLRSGCAMHELGRGRALVETNSVSFASPQAGKLNHYVVSPPPTQPALLGLRGDPMAEVVMAHYPATPVLFSRCMHSIVGGNYSSLFF